MPGEFEPDRSPQAIHGAEQMWAIANNHLQKIIDEVKSNEPGIYAKAGNTDPSVLYDWFKMYIQVAEQRAGAPAHDMTILMCCAAITRLVRDERTEVSDVLTQLEKENWNK